MTDEIIDENKEQIVETEEPEVKWEPVAKPDVREGLDPYEDAPKSVRDFHESYCNTWLRHNNGR